MKQLQRSGKGIQFVLLVLSLLGVGITIYLTAVHYENVPLVCSENGLVNCARVISSSYSVVPGTTVPITIPGFGWCIVSACFGNCWLVFNNQIMAAENSCSAICLGVVRLVGRSLSCLYRNCAFAHNLCLVYCITCSNSPNVSSHVNSVTVSSI